MKEWFKNRWNVYMVLVGFIFLYLFFGEIVPLAGEVFEVMGQYREDKVSYELHKNWKSRLVSYRRELSSINQNINRQFVALPSSAEFSKVMDGITGLAKKQKIDISEILPAAPKNRKFYDSWPITCTFTSDFHQGMAYINALENGRLIIHVTSLTIAAEKPYSKILHFTTQMNVYTRHGRANKP